MPIACANACSLSPVASSRCAAFVAVPLNSARHAPGRLRGRYSSHRRAASSANGRAASSRCSPSSAASSDLAKARIWPASESALIIGVYHPPPRASVRSVASSGPGSGTARKKAASTPSTAVTAARASSPPRSVTRILLARVSAASTVRTISPLASSLRSTSEVILTSVPACRATLSWFGSSPREFSHQAAASSTNCTWVRPSGASAAAISRCQRSVTCQSRNPGLSSGSSGTGSASRPLRQRGYHLGKVRGDLRAELGADPAGRLAGDLRPVDDPGQAAGYGLQPVLGPHHEVTCVHLVSERRARLDLHQPHPDRLVPGRGHGERGADRERALHVDR